MLSAIATGAIVLGLKAVGALQGLELGVYDQMMRLRPTPNPDARVLVVGITEADVQARQEWPIQDSTMAEVLEVLLASEPRAIGLDIFRDIAIGDGQATLLSTIQRSDLIVPVCKMSSPNHPGVPPPTGTPADRVSFSDFVVDAGGILRRNLLIAAPPADSQAVNTHLCNTPDAQLLSLSLQLALRYLAQEGINPTFTEQQELQLGTTVLPRLQSNIGGYHNIEASGYQLLLNYRAAQAAIPQVSLGEVLAGQVRPEQIRDRVVLIGAITPAAKDEFYTPFSGGLQDSQKMSGVVVHAQSVSQILSAVLDDRPLLWSWSSLGEAGWIMAWGLGGALFAWYIRRPLPYTIGAAMLLGGLYGVCYLFFLQGGWIPLLPAGLALALASVGVLLLDRFNKSDYGQAVYQQMKTLLRLEIDIDQTKVNEQVAEITNTDYFSELQAQAKALREKQQPSQSASNAPAKLQPPSESLSTSSEPQASEDVDDYVNNLKRKARDIKVSEGDVETPDES